MIMIDTFVVRKAASTSASAHKLYPPFSSSSSSSTSSSPQFFFLGSSLHGGLLSTRFRDKSFYERHTADPMVK